MLRKLIEARAATLKDLRQRKILIDKAVVEVEQAQAEDTARLKEIEGNEEPA